MDDYIGLCIARANRRGEYLVDESAILEDLEQLLAAGLDAHLDDAARHLDHSF
jgi:hypothetical protein